MKKRILGRVLAGLLVVAASAAPAYAETVAAHFGAGNTDAAVDGYVGMAGDGWAGPWGTPTRYATVTASVTDTSPLFVGGGNYLDCSTEIASAQGQGSVGRKYTSTTDGIDITYDHSISFKYRIDEDLSSPATTFTDVDAWDNYALFDHTSVRYGTNKYSAWMINGNPYNPLGFPDNWLVYNGDNQYGVTEVDTGIQLQQGVVYDFQIYVHADTKKWDVTISNGTTTFDSTLAHPDGLGWRTSAATVGGTINFAGQGSADNDVRRFSVDALSITGVGVNPNPGPPMSPVVAYFAGGNSNTVVDAYHGIAGNGWKTPWQDITSPNAVLSSTVVAPGDTNFDEVKPGSGAYLSYSATNTTNTLANVGVVRNYRTTGENPGITWTEAHTIQFTLRIDEDVNDPFLFTDGGDIYAVFDSPLAQGGTNSSCTWITYATSMPEDPASRKWLVTDGNNDGTCVDVNSQIALVTGGVYDFTITVDPNTLTYDAIISDGTATYDSRIDHPEGLGWRSSASSIGGYLSFTSRGNTVDDVRAFSLDDVLITQSLLPPIPGDTNNDRKIDATDAAKLASNWGATVSNGATDGDFNGDNLVNAMDASILAANWGDHTGSESASTVPEPSAIVLLLGTMIGLLSRRRP